MATLLDTGFVDLSTFASVDTGNAAWTNPGDAQSSNNSYAFTGAATGAGQSVPRQAADTLRALSPVGISIPVYATIVGVEARFERKKVISGTGNIWDNSIRLVKAGTIVGDNKSTGAAWPTTDTYVSHGGSADLWGITLTPADIDANFGFAIAVDYEVPGSNQVARAEVDHMQIRIFYTNPYDGFFAVL